MLSDAPSAYYRFEETSGATAADSSGASRNAQYQAGVTYGVPGALVSDSSDTAVSSSTGPVAIYSGTGLPTANSARTYEFWMKGTATPSGSSNPNPLLSNGDFGLKLWNDGTSDFIDVTNGSLNHNYALPYSVHNGVWHMLTVSWDGGTAGIYADGQIVTHGGLGVYNTGSTAGLTVGGYPGAFDEVALYPSALSDSRVGAHWTAGGSKSSACATSPTTGYGRGVMTDAPRIYLGLKDLNQDSTDRVAYDLSGNCANGAYSTGAVADPGDGPVGNGTGAVTLPGTWVTQSGQNLPTGNSPRTYELWFKGTATPSGSNSPNPLLFNGDFGLQLWNNGTNDFMDVMNGSQNHNYPLPYSVHDGVWHMLTVTTDGATAGIYADGQSVTPLAVLGVYNTGLTAGLRVGGYPGSYHEVAVYPNALSADRVNAHWTAGGSKSPACAASPNWGYAQTVLAAGPKLYMGLKDLNQDSSDRVAFDLSGQCANGTYYPGAAANAGDAPAMDNGGSVSFPQGAHMTQTGQKLPTGNGQRTYVVWFKSTTTPLGSCCTSPVLWHDDFGIQLWNDGTHDLVDVMNGSFNHNAVLPVSVHDGVWHMIAASWDGNNAVAYLDGAGVATWSYFPYATHANGGLLFGGYPAAYTELAVYDKALNPTILALQYAAGSGSGPLGGGVSAAELFGNNNLCFSCFAKTIRAIAGDPVDTATGNFSETFQDIMIPGRGLPINFNRTYNSGAAATSSPIGYGWTFSYNASLTFDNPNNKVTVNQENAAQVVFTLSNGAYGAPPRAIATLVKNGDGTFTFTRQHRQILKFSASGQLTSEADLNGYTTTLGYNGSGQLTTITDPAGRALTLSYSSGLVQTVTDSGARMVRFGYNDGASNLTDITDVDGNLWHFAYDPNHLLTTITDGRGNTITNHYDTQNRVDWQRDRRNNTTTFAYSGSPLSAAGGSTVVTDAMGNKVQDQYQYGLRTATTKGYGTPSAATWRSTFDPATVAVTTLTDPNGNVTASTYDLSGNQLSVTDALGRKTQRAWDGLGDMTSTTDPLGVTTTNTFDANGNRLSSSTTLQGTSQTRSIQNHYDDGSHPGDVTSTTDPDGKVWSYTYDGNGDQTGVTDPLGDRTVGCFDSIGRKTTIISPRGTGAGVTCGMPAPASYTSYMTYDPAGNITKTTDPLQHSTVNVYDADQNLKQVTDGNGNVTTYHYDENNENDSITKGYGTPQQQVTKTDYNKDGTVHDQIDGLGNQTTYGYDPLERVTSVTDPIHPATTYTYDGAGRKLTMVDGQHQTTTYAYDAADQLTGASYSDGSTNAVTNIQYDADGQRTQMTDGTGTSIWQYDSLHRMTSNKNGAGATVTYGYDLRGHVTTIGYPTAGNNVARGYDDAGRMHTVSDWLGATTTFNYDANSNMTSEQYPNGIVANMSPDAANQTTSIVDSKGGNQFLNLTYTRDQVGNVKSDTNPAHSYGYDSNNRLTDVDSSNYGYDKADNLTGMTTGYTQNYDAANEVLGSQTPIAPVGVVQTKSDPGPASSVTISLPAGIQPNDQILIAATYESASSISTPTGYTVVATANSPGTTPAQTVVFQKTAALGESGNVTVAFSGLPASKSLVAVAYRGVDPTNPIDATGSSSPSGPGATSVTAPSVSTSLGGDRLLMFQGAGGNAPSGTFTAPTGMTESGTVTESLSAAGLAEQPLSDAAATGTRQAGFTGPGGANLTGINVALKPAVTQFGYDSRGNRTSTRYPGGSTVAMGYDQANRMKSFGNAAGYTYNGDGLRMSKTVSGQTQQFTWDQAEGLPMMLTDGTGANYIYGPGGVPLEHVFNRSPIQMVGTPTTGGDIGTGSSVTVPLPSDLKANDLILIASTEPTGNSVSASGFTALATVASSGGTLSNGETTVLRKIAAGGETGVQVNYSGIFAKSVVVVVYRGVDPLYPSDDVKGGVTNAPGTSVTIPGMTTGLSGDELLLFEGAQSHAVAGSFTKPTTMTDEKQKNDQPLTATGIADEQWGHFGWTGSRQFSFSQAANLTGISVALRPLASVYYYHQDQLGSTRALTDAAGAVQASWTYDAYGNITSRTSGASTPLLYAGQYQDSESGLYYLRARYYDPTTSQFINRDPLTFSTRQPYAYTGDNPLNSTDPSGLCDWWDVGCHLVRQMFANAADEVGVATDAATWLGQNGGGIATGCLALSVVAGPELAPFLWTCGAIAGSAAVAYDLKSGQPLSALWDAGFTGTAAKWPDNPYVVAGLLCAEGAKRAVEAVDKLPPHTVRYDQPTHPGTDF